MAHSYNSYISWGRPKKCLSLYDPDGISAEYVAKYPKARWKHFPKRETTDHFNFRQPSDEEIQLIKSLVKNIVKNVTNQINFNITYNNQILNDSHKKYLNFSMDKINQVVCLGNIPEIKENPCSKVFADLYINNINAIHELQVLLSQNIKYLLSEKLYNYLLTQTLIESLPKHYLDANGLVLLETVYKKAKEKSAKERKLGHEAYETIITINQEEIVESTHYFNH